MEINNNKKVLSACIIGKPNAGKSTLLNYIIGQKISIVTPKVQTTRTLITGIVNIDDTQIILFDTPGIFEAKKKMEKSMVKCAWSSISNADVVILIIDTTKPMDNNFFQITKRLMSLNKDIIFLMNKIDVRSKHYIDNINHIEKLSDKSNIFNISALKGKGVNDLLDRLKAMSYKSEWLYGEDDITDLPSRFLANEITREQLFLKLEQEIPYNLKVECEKWESNNDGSVKINQVITVSRESYKTIVLGKNGNKIKNIGIESRKNIEELLGYKIHLFLFVRVRKDWEDRDFK